MDLRYFPIVISHSRLWGGLAHPFDLGADLPSTEPVRSAKVGIDHVRTMHQLVLLERLVVRIQCFGNRIESVEHQLAPSRSMLTYHFCVD